MNYPTDYLIRKGQGPSLSILAAEPAVQDVIARYEGKVTPAQVLLSWGVHRGTVVVPKSENEERLRTNITVCTNQPL